MSEVFSAGDDRRHELDIEDVRRMKLQLAQTQPKQHEI
jgi:hypothetical protein